ncbi:MAG: protein jag [Spirochaetes bacterium]|nr:protein jag [Spirochaetota bacterium]
MITKEFEGKNEKAAIKKAVVETGLPEEKLKIEVLKKGKSGFMGMGDKEGALISVSYDENVSDEIESSQEAPLNDKSDDNENEKKERPERTPANKKDRDEYEDAILDFLEELFTKMDLEVDLWIKDHYEDKVFVEMKSPSSALIIGKRGKTLEALQLLTNIAASRKINVNLKAVVDIEGYRDKRQGSLNELALRVASEVRKSKKSKFLEPMNPFERRLIHMALQDVEDIETMSEGEGIYRKVKISLK